MIVALFVLLAATDTPVGSGPRPLSPPGTWFSSDDYPPAAIRAQQEGAVRFSLDVSPTGAITACRIVESSTFSDLDAQTCASAMKNARFSPALDRKGQPMASTFTQRTRWVLPTPTVADDMATPFGMWGNSMNMVTATVAINVDPQGAVLQCKLTLAANTTVDPCMAFPVGKKVIAPLIVDGKAVAAKVAATTIISVRPNGRTPTVPTIP
ncbi:energy transducer TonB [uncultured Sphingomonas sp.]|uniref:energy transducer TonB n=1 Tax=uncultured Sphingomonas sp. TaxID=158754 RepID=UPI0035CC4D2C